MQCPFQCGSLEVQEVKTDWKSANESLKGSVDSRRHGWRGGAPADVIYTCIYRNELVFGVSFSYFQVF